MTLDFEALKWIGTLAVPVLGWAFKQIAELRKAINDLQLHVAEKYATNDYVGKRLDKMDEKLDRLIERSN